MITIEEPYHVGVFPNNKLRQGVSLADSTGHIELVLWRERAESISFSEGDVLCLENVVVLMENVVVLTFETAISKVDILTHFVLFNCLPVYPIL